ncbi:hypothetical protein ACP70R_019181 [Stipagrostis hirtigluma subsp. patula]
MVQPDLACPWAPSELSCVPVEQEPSDVLPYQHSGMAIASTPRLQMGCI